MIRPKWHAENRNVQNNDAVLVQGSGAGHGKWKLGIVSESLPGNDDEVRRVKVVCKNLPTQDKIYQYKGTKDTTIEWALQRRIVLNPENEGDINQ